MRTRQVSTGRVAGVGVGIVLSAGLLSVPPSTLSLLPVATLDLLASLARMFLAYLLSLVFALGYGYFASAQRSAERVMIPILDILQSVPILGFFPVAIIFFVGLTGPQSLVGPNLASIFLIFTSMSWNMAFGVYESLKGLPNDMREATLSFGSRGFQRLRRVLFPATVNRLVYNSQLSWAAGWFFLVAAEIITTSTSSVSLPGIGSFLLIQAQSGDIPNVALGVILLIVLIVLLDVFVWRPLARWAEKYRYDQTPSGESDAGVEARTSVPWGRVAGRVMQGMVSGLRRVQAPFASLGSRTLARRGPVHPHSRARTAIKYVILGTILVIGWFVLIFLSVVIYQSLFGQPISSFVMAQIRTVPLALGLSLLRILAAYAVCVVVAIPLAIFLTRNPRAGRVGLPLVQIVASVPATALFPLLAIVLLRFVGDEALSVLVLVTGMIWYVFFNFVSGLRGIPPDLEETARSFGLKKGRYYRRLIFPGSYPAFITGSITAFGSGWNTLILAEYLVYGSNPPIVNLLGIGELLQIGSLPGEGALLVVSLLTLVGAVIAFNEALWKPLYRRVVEKYHFD